jgi:WD40 repeat protein
VGTGKETAVLTARQGKVLAVAFTPDGRTPATGDEVSTEPGFESALKFWDVETAQEQTGPECMGGVRAIAFSPDGKAVAVGLGTAVQVWDLSGPEPKGRRLTGHEDKVFSVAFAPDGKRLASSADDVTF